MTSPQDSGFDVSTTVIDSTPNVDPYSLNGGANTDFTQSSSGESYYSLCALPTECGLEFGIITPTLAPIDQIDTTDPVVITDPLPVDPPICVGFEPYFGALNPPDGISLDGGYQVLQDGTSLASGWSTDGSDTPVLVDYNEDGSVNTEFAKNGVLYGPEGASYIWASQSAAGAIQVQGWLDIGDGTSSFFFEQFTASGQLDTSFGGGTGSLTAPFGFAFTGIFMTLSNGDILAGATSNDGANTSLVVDYTNSGVVNTSFGNNGEIVAPKGVTSEWFYQDQSTGDVVINYSTLGDDGVSTLVSSYYTIDGQIDVSTPSVTYIFDPIPVDAPVEMYNKAGGMTERTVTLTSNVSGSSIGNTGTNQTNQASPVEAVSNTVSFTKADSYVISPEYKNTAFSTSASATSLSGASSTRDVQAFIVSDQSSSSPHVEVFNSAPSGISGVSALKLAAAAASNVSKGSTGEHAGDFVAASDSLDLALPVSLKEGFSLPKKPTKIADPDVPEASTANEPQSEEDLISAFLVEA
jgi:hypothetical protein